MDDDKKQKEQKEECITKILFSNSLIFNQDIDELWLFLRNKENTVKIIDKFDNLDFIKGDKSFIIGNIFTVKWIGLTILKYRCISIKVDGNKKEIIWKAEGDIGIKYYKTMTLFRISHDNKTLVKVVISKKQKKSDINNTITDYNYYSNFVYDVLLKISSFLNSIYKDIISHESCIINKNYLSVWNYISDLKKINSILPIIGTNFEFNSPQIKAGKFMKFNIKELNIIVFMKIIEIVEINEIKKNKSCWIKLETIGSKVDNSPKMIEYKITMIDDKTSCLSIIHQFYYNINKEFFNKFSINKKEIIKKYKKLIEE